MRLAFSTALLLAAAGVSRPGCGTHPPEPPPCVAQEPCAGKACGAECATVGPCGSEMPSALGQCNAQGDCVAWSDAPPPCAPSAACAGKTCGTACDTCGGACANPVAGACDHRGVCVPSTPSICYDPCGGKACGASCQLCPPDAPDCAEFTIPKVCDGVGRCVPQGVAPACS